MMSSEKRSEYQKLYKKYHYKKTRKIITFPLLLQEFENLKNGADNRGISSNKLAKEIVLNHLENKSKNFQSNEQLDLIKEYVKISRGIVTNINKMAHNLNIGEVVEISIFIDLLKNYEDEFNALINRVL